MTADDPHKPRLTASEILRAHLEGRVAGEPPSAPNPAQAAAAIDRKLGTSLGETVRDEELAKLLERERPGEEARAAARRIGSVLSAFWDELPDDMDNHHRGLLIGWYASNFFTSRGGW